MKDLTEQCGKEVASIVEIKQILERFSLRERKRIMEYLYDWSTETTSLPDLQSGVQFNQASAVAQQQAASGQNFGGLFNK